MAAQVHKIAFDAEATQRQAAWDLRKFIITTTVSTVLALAAAVGAGIAIGNYYAHRELPPAPPPPQIVFQPGSIVVRPAPAK